MDPIKASGKFGKLTEQIAERVEKLDFVLAFWVHGSRAVGREREDSDINYAFLVKKRADIHELQEHFRDLIKWKNAPGYYPEQHWEVATWKEEQWTFKDIHWTVFTPEELHKFDNLFDARITHTTERWLEPFQETHLLRYQGEAEHFFIKSVIVADKEGIIADTKKLLSDYPDKVSGGVVNWALDKLRKRLPWHGNPWVARSRIAHQLDIKEDLYYIAIAHYAKNKRFVENGLKYWEEDMKSMQPDLRELVDKLITFDQEDKHEIMVDIIQALNKEDVF